MPLLRRNTTPIFRWAGGKRWLLDEIAAIAGAWNPTSYFEPFAGGAAVYLAFDWPRPTVSDINADLVAAYRGIARSPNAVAAGLSALPVCRHQYDSLRGSQPDDDIGRAVRLLYLNRCGYGGIYRTDKHGTFNVPFSGDRTTHSLWRDGRLRQIGKAFASADIIAADFELPLEAAGPGSFVYCDPAYALPEAAKIFRRYASGSFSWSDQERLATVAHELRARGALVVVSNSSDERVANLYRGALVKRFSRRVPLPKARGGHLDEAIYVLGDADSASAMNTIGGFDS